MAFIENEERGKVDRKWGKIYSYSTWVKQSYVPQKICFLDIVNKLITNKDVTNSVPENIKDPLYHPEDTEANLIKIINSMKNRRSRGLEGASYTTEYLLENINAMIKKKHVPILL